MTKNKKIKIALLCLCALLLCIVLCYWNNNLGVTFYTLQPAGMPKELSGFRIVQISDLHNKEFGKDNEKLIDKVKELSPDVIFVTGDVIDGRRKGFEKTKTFAEKLKGISPIFYVTGNHEYRLNETEREEILETLSQNGFEILDDKSVDFEYNGKIFAISGINDPWQYSKNLEETDKTLTKEQIDELTEEFVADKVSKVVDTEKFNIVLSHRNMNVDVYSKTGADIVFCGHGHGGQIRLPFDLGALYAKRQGFFPDYFDGTWEDNGTIMVVSRGLGNSIFPFRVFNCPEIVCVDLK